MQIGFVIVTNILQFSQMIHEEAKALCHLPLNTTICTLIAKNIYQVRLPLLFALNHVNCYLLQDDDGWTMLDTGLNRPEIQTAWQAAAALVAGQFEQPANGCA